MAALGIDALAWALGAIAIGLAIVSWRLTKQETSDWARAYCGCTPTSSGDSDKPISCTLDAVDYQNRVQRLRALASRALRSVRQDDLRLVLTYEPEAFSDVNAIAQAERMCCGFMQFDVHRDRNAVTLTITAPQEARAVSDELFAHFAPEFIRHSSSLKKEIAI